jgi:intein-encoded DNA endonuclease-like protein
MAIPREELNTQENFKVKKIKLKKIKLKKNKIEKKLTDLELAYIAGFLDGDGSIIAQIVKDKSAKYNFTVRVSLSFYQKKKRH